jgi:glycosyltransferase involved in cell wall biosynthesis
LGVAAETAKRLGRRTSILFVGAGTLENSIRAAAALHEPLVDTVIHGFAAQRELPDLYRSARIFLFPTVWDPWGVVANEACAAGLPVIVSPEAGVAGELVRDGENGFVCSLDPELWAQRATMLLARPALHEDFSRRSLRLVGDYSYDNAAAGLVEACRFSLRETEPLKIRMPV